MTNEELTQIYNEANGLNPNRRNMITTERIFSAMRGAMAAEREECAKMFDGFPDSKSFGGTVTTSSAAQSIRNRSSKP